ncbi:unnamed protein product [Absidia cylindrospora]
MEIADHDGRTQQLHHASVTNDSVTIPTYSLDVVMAQHQIRNDKQNICDTISNTISFLLSPTAAALSWVVLSNVTQDEDNQIWMICKELMAHWLLCLARFWIQCSVLV